MRRRDRISAMGLILGRGPRVLSLGPAWQVELEAQAKPSAIEFHNSVPARFQIKFKLEWAQALAHMPKLIAGSAFHEPKAE